MPDDGLVVGSDGSESAHEGKVPGLAHEDELRTPALGARLHPKKGYPGATCSRTLLWQHQVSSFKSEEFPRPKTAAFL